VRRAQGDGQEQDEAREERGCLNEPEQAHVRRRPGGAAYQAVDTGREEGGDTGERRAEVVGADVANRGEVPVPKHGELPCDRDDHRQEIGGQRCGEAACTEAARELKETEAGKGEEGCSHARIAMVLLAPPLQAG
jgi:hypothetical protein